MHVISRKGLLAASEAYGDAQSWLGGWLRVAERAVWSNLDDVRKTYPIVDQVGKCLVFNVKGNVYRLIVTVVWPSPPRTKGTLFVKYFLPHAEYDKNAWKGCC